MRLSRSSCLRNSSWLRPPKVCPLRLSICSIISRSSSSRISSRLRPAITHCTEDHGLVVLVVYQVVQSAQTFLRTACGFRSLCGLTNSSQWWFHLPSFYIAKGKDSYTAFYGCRHRKDDSCVCNAVDTRLDKRDRGMVPVLAA